MLQDDATKRAPDPDNIPPISYSERAVMTFPSAELIRFEGAGHGFHGSDETQAEELVIDFVKRHLGDPSRELCQ